MLYKRISLITGNPKTGSEEEKTIMLVGATGSGKSTLVDGIVNYVMGVSFDDPFRFTLVQLEEEEKKTHNQVTFNTIIMSAKVVYFVIGYKDIIYSHLSVVLFNNYLLIIVNRFKTNQQRKGTNYKLRIRLLNVTILFSILKKY